VEILTKAGIFRRDNFPLVDIIKQIVAEIDFEGKNHSDRAGLVHTELRKS
jgi:hypothetical protein